MEGFHLSLNSRKAPTPQQIVDRRLFARVITFNFAKTVSVQEQSLANEIAEFALEQDAVKSFLTQNGISANADYTVLNATEFYSNTNATSVYLFAFRQGQRGTEKSEGSILLLTSIRESTNKKKRCV